MWALYKKEISGFFSSLTGYVVILVFLLLNGLFMWVVPGQFNLLETGVASLDTMFAIAPWLYLFLVPAISMRTLAEEKRSGTLDLLLTRPVSEWQIVLAKFAAVWTLVLLSMVPTFLHLWSVYRLGSPPGNLDMGGSLGSYVGLFFLGGIYAAIGLFSSALTSNQVVSFLLAVVLSFLLYLGFDFLSGLAGSGRLAYFVSKLGIGFHYSSVSRGILDSRDLLYFLGAIALFVTGTRHILHRKRIGRLLLTLAGLALVWLLSASGFFRIDLTSEKRYSLSDASRNLLGELDQTVMVKVYLDGDLPPEFLNFRKSVQELMEEFRAYAGEKVVFSFENLYDIEDEEQRNRVIGDLYDRGLQVTSVQARDREGRTATQMIFPGAMVTYGGYEVAVNLLKNNPALSHEVNLNNSLQTLEYEFARALHSLVRTDVPKIAFVEGHGELDSLQTHSLMNGLRDFFQVDRGHINGNAEVLLDYQAVVVARPVRSFSEADKFALDQYLMHGGKLLFFLDPVQSFADSLTQGTTVALARPSGLEDMLFRYGVRVNYDLVADLQCGAVPVNMAPAGEQARFSLMPWVYHPLLAGPGEHPVTRGLNYVRAQFASSLDTLNGGEGEVDKTVLLTSSPTARRRQVPLYLSMEEVMEQPDPRVYNEAAIPMAVLVQGKFTSFYKNYPVPAGATLNGGEIRAEGGGGAVFVMTDGDVPANEVRMEGGRVLAQPLGYDPYTRQTFGNREFLLNLINYMTDDTGIMELRSREFRLRLLQPEVSRNRSAALRWKLLNVALPPVLVIVAGILLQIRRKKRHATGPNLET